jgi:hypothetical protein
VQLPIGPWLKTSTDQHGNFAFLDIPVAKYLVFADPGMMSANGLAGNQQSLDLTVSPELNTTLDARSAASTRHGTLSSKEGEWVPFAWLQAPDQLIYPVDPQSGGWSAPASDDGDWLVLAPGYYSRRVDLSRAGTSALQQVTLLERPEMRSLKWGQGQILVPPETQAKAAEGIVDFDAGWIWGSNPADEGYIIRLEEGEIRIRAGKFALEREPGGIAWVYLFDGSAELLAAGTQEAVSIRAGEMAALSRGAMMPFPYAAEVIPALQPLNEAPLNAVWEPTLMEKIRSESGELGVVLAQFVTFITYLFALLLLVALPLLAVRWMRRYHQSTGAGSGRK